MGEGKTHRAAQPVAHTAHRTNAARGPWRLLGTAHRGLHEQKAVTGDREPDLLLQALSALGAVSCFCGGEKSHLQILFQSQNLFRQSYKRDNGGGGGEVCMHLSDSVTHTHTCLRDTGATF